MGQITTGVGPFSGIDTASLIDQLISASSRPQILAQQRVIQLKSQQAAYLDINSRLNAFKTAAASFRVNDIFSSRSITSSNESILSATAGSSAVPGSYNFIVDRLVSTQQVLSRGFADLDNSPIGLDSLTFESEDARIDANTALADLNDGNGITRGKIEVNGIEVDLSTAGTVQEVLDAISEVPGVSARVENDHFVITGVEDLEEASGAGILASLGFSSVSNADPAVEQTGTTVYGMNNNTSLQSLNDGRGISTRDTIGEFVYDFEVVVDGNVVGVRIGDIFGDLVDDEGEPILDDEGVQETGTIEGAVSSVGGVINRINDALAENYPEVTASIDASTGSISFNDTSSREIEVRDITVGTRTYTTATDLGIVGSDLTGSFTGSRILAGMNTKLVSSLNGATGLGTSDGLLTFDTQDGGNFTIDVSGFGDINDIINAINTNAGNFDGSSNQRLFASVNEHGTGIQIADQSSGGGTFTISGTGGADTAEALGISGSFATGQTEGTNLQLAYLGRSSLLSELNNGTGIGTGRFEITGPDGGIFEVNVTNNDKTLGDIIDSINSAGNDKVVARINDTGDGILIEKGSAATGDLAISVSNTTGTVATKLGLEGTSSGTGADNIIDGSFEKTVEFDPDATLADIRNAINSANVGVSASVINTGIGTSPFRLNLTSELTGRDGRFLIDAGDFDLGLDVLDEGNDARVFFGSTDPASAVLMNSSVNQLDGVVEGVTIDLHSTSDEAVELSVSTNTGEIETKIEEFITAFNNVIEGIDFRTRYDDETQERGVLLGDGTMLNLRNSMYSTLNRSNQGFTSAFDTLSEVGIKVGSGGTLEFDSAKFRDAYAEDPTAVENLFSQQTQDSIDDDDPNTIDETFFSELSVLGQLEEFADSYVSSIGGVLQSRTDALDSQIELQEDRIESIQQSLNNKREILSRQFLAMEQAIGSLQTQGSSLSQLAALG